MRPIKHSSVGDCALCSPATHSAVGHHLMMETKQNRMKQPSTSLQKWRCPRREKIVPSSLIVPECLSTTFSEQVINMPSRTSWLLHHPGNQQPRQLHHLVTNYSGAGIRALLLWGWGWWHLKERLVKRNGSPGASIVEIVWYRQCLQKSMPCQSSSLLKNRNDSEEKWFGFYFPNFPAISFELSLK